MRQITPPVEELRVRGDPFYLPVGDEVELFQQAVSCRLPVLLKGPTGSGKTRFVAHMAARLGLPLVTVACHDDLSASDLVGRFVILGDETVWVDGPLTAAVRHGAIIYLDELVEARKDTMVVIHPLTDDRRILPVEKLGTVLEAADTFQVVVSYNPGYQSALKELKPSTRQRFVAMEFGYPPPALEREVVAREAGVDEELARPLVEVAVRIRNLVDRGLDEGPSTRLVIYAARLVAAGASPRAACAATFGRILTDDHDLRSSIGEIVADFF